MTGNSTAVFWFRRDLRFEDNHGLSEALARHERVLPIFIFDRDILDALEDRSDARVTFIHRRISELDRELRNGGNGGILTCYGTPTDAFRSLLETHRIAAVYTNRDYEPYAVKRDRAVAELLKDSDIPFFDYKDQCIFEKEEILTGGDKPYTVFTPYKNKWLSILESWHLASFETKVGPLTRNASVRPVIPLGEMNFRETGLSIPDTRIDESTLQNYDQLRDYPGLNATSLLGIHLRFGTLSIRALARKAREINLTWLSQLIWRDFYMQILFHFPEVTTRSFRPQYDLIQWRNNPKEFDRWCEGNTGFPIVDAGMRQLNETGIMHNRVRMITASFLCKNLLIDWRWGERYFAARLLDFDLAANNGNWQWAAGTGCDAAPYFRVFNPWTQTKKFDPEMKYIKQWCPDYLDAGYPTPMVDLDATRKRALATYKTAIDMFQGKEPKAADSRQKSLF